MKYESNATTTLRGKGKSSLRLSQARVSVDLNQNNQITENILGYNEEESPLQHCIRHPRLRATFIYLFTYF